VTQLFEPIPSKQFRIFTELYRRLLLEPAPAPGSNAAMSPVILPVTSVDDLLLDKGVRNSDLGTYTAGQTAQINCHTVPAGERWTLWGYNVDAQLTGDNNIDSVSAVIGGFRFTFEAFTGAQTRNFMFPGTGVTLNEADRLQAAVDGTGVAAGSIRFTVLVDIESV